MTGPAGTGKGRILEALANVAGAGVAKQVGSRWRSDERMRKANAARAREAARLQGQRAGAEPRAAAGTAAAAAEVTHKPRPRRRLSDQLEAKAKRNAERERRARENNARHLARYAERLRAAGQGDAAPVGIPPMAWSRIQMMKRDASGRAHRRCLAELPAAVARRLYRAATLGGARPLEHPSARKTCIALVGLWWCSKPSRLPGHARVTVGIPLGMVDAWVRDAHVTRPVDEHGRLVYPRARLTGVDADGRPGYVLAGAEFGALKKAQPRFDAVPSSERGPSGWAFNQYHWWRYSPRGGDGGGGPEVLWAAQADSGPGVLLELGIIKPPPDAADVGPPS